MDQGGVRVAEQKSDPKNVGKGEGAVTPSNKRLMTIRANAAVATVRDKERTRHESRGLWGTRAGKSMAM